MGDPAGIGPEVCVKAGLDAAVLAVSEPLLVGSREVFLQASRLAGLSLDSEIEDPVGRGGFACGEISADAGLAAYRSLMRAIDLALLGEVDAVVTAPINKAALHRAGIFENGHTEILAKATGVTNYALMLTSQRLSCIFVTCHQSLASVAESLTRRRVVEAAELANQALTRLLGRRPRLGMLALNPHAGEEGIFGREEIEILIPAASDARASGLDISDPIPADTAFTPRAIGRYDGYLCMYHDQGGIPFKMISFDDGVNVTLGLPIIRTSVDHGTAFDIAWQGQADPSSMIAAALLAARLAPGSVSNG